MLWLTLLLQSLPTLVKIIAMILERIAEKPSFTDRRAARQQLFGLAQQHLSTLDEASAVADFTAFHESLI